MPVSSVDWMAAMRASVSPISCSVFISRCWLSLRRRSRTVPRSWSMTFNEGTMLTAKNSTCALVLPIFSTPASAMAASRARTMKNPAPSRAPILRLRISMHPLRTADDEGGASMRLVSRRDSLLVRHLSDGAKKTGVFDENAWRPEFFRYTSGLTRTQSREHQNSGEVAEWLNVPDSKSGGRKRLGGSNPPLSSRTVNHD